MTKRFEDTIISLLQSMDGRMDRMEGNLSSLNHTVQSHDKKLGLIIDILANQDAKLKEHDKRFDTMDGKFKQHDERFDKIDTKFKQHDERFDRIDTKFKQHDERFDKIDTKFKQHDEKFDQIIVGIIPEIEKRNTHSIKLKNHERRIRHLEAAWNSLVANNRGVRYNFSLYSISIPG